MGLVKCLVPVSGGKDSQTCLELAIEEYGCYFVRGLFCDTKFEHPDTYEHVAWMESYYQVEIDYVCAGSVEEKCKKYGRFPGGGARHCTEELKIVPTKKYCKALAESQGGFEVWYGMRTGESNDREKRYSEKIDSETYAPHEIMPGKYPKYLNKLGVKFRLPILKWGKQQVLQFLGESKLNPLYLKGFDRVGCFPCQAAGDYHKEKAYSLDDFGHQQFIKIKELSEEIGKPMFNSKRSCQRNNPDQIGMFSGPGCAICSI